MSKFLISLDLDGTLLTSENKITEYTQKVLKRAQEQGHKVMIASGRAPRAIMKFYNQLNLDTPFICYNGAMVCDPQDLNYKSSVYKFEKEKILRFCSEFGDSVINVMCENENSIWADADDEFLFTFYRKDQMNVQIGPINDILTADPITFIAKYNDTPENRDKIVKIVETNTDIKVRFWDCDNYFELYYEGVSKYHSLVKIAEYYSIAEDDIFAFGDADNDIEVMTHCKHGIAMKNSSKMLLDLSKFVTEFTNNEDGVAKYIEKHILKEE